MTDPLVCDPCPFAPRPEPCGLAWAPVLAVWFTAAALSVGAVLLFDRLTGRITHR